MTKTIITISREFGSGGRCIGKTLAEKLGFSFYDKEIIEQVAKKTGLSEKHIEEHGEYASQGSMFAYSFIGRDMQGQSIDDYIFQTQQALILDIADKGNCVIIGRCADYILRNRSDVLNVFIHGSEPEKCKRIMELYHKTEAQARILMKNTDKKRAVNYAYQTEQKWGAAKNYALCLNSSILGYETCIEMISGIFK